MKLTLFSALFTFLSVTFAGVASANDLPSAKKIVFLGDSITQDGRYIDYLETILLAETSKRYEILDMGLSSETVSGLTESTYKDGKVSRPAISERVDRVLSKTKPGLVLACYGMNDGIYQPFNEGRFDRFAAGIERLRASVAKYGAGITHVTPPVFDPLPIQENVVPAGSQTYSFQKPFKDYNNVLDVYSERLVRQGANFGWRVIDVHTAMGKALAEKRKTDPAFTFAKDGVHPDAEGHWLIAQQILKAWRLTAKAKFEDFAGDSGRLAMLHQYVAQRQKILKASWMKECGKTLPDLEALPLDEAQAKAKEITEQIEAELLRLAGTPLFRAPEPENFLQQ